MGSVHLTVLLMATAHLTAAPMDTVRLTAAIVSPTVVDTEGTKAATMDKLYGARSV